MCDSVGAYPPRPQPRCSRRSSSFVACSPGGPWVAGEAAAPRGRSCTLGLRGSGKRVSSTVGTGGVGEDEAVTDPRAGGRPGEAAREDEEFNGRRKWSRPRPQLARRAGGRRAGVCSEHRARGREGRLGAPAWSGALPAEICTPPPPGLGRPRGGQAEHPASSAGSKTRPSPAAAPPLAVPSPGWFPRRAAPLALSPEFSAPRRLHVLVGGSSRMDGREWGVP